MKKIISHLLICVFILFLTADRLKAQDEYDPCQSCDLLAFDGATNLVREFRQDLGAVVPFFGPSSSSYLGSGASPTIGLLSGIVSLFEGVSSITNLVGTAGFVNTLLGAANDFSTQSAELQNSFNGAMHQLDNAICDCFRRNNCANGCM